MQHAPLANAACCILHPTARQYCGEASSPSKPSASCCFLIPSEKSCQCLFSCGPVPSAALGCASCCAGFSCSLVRASAFCCAVQCPLLCGSVHSFVRTNGVAGVGCRSGNDVGMGLWSLGLRAGASRLAGSGKSNRCFEKRSAAGWIGPTAALACAERQGFEPWIQSPVCRISSAVHSTTLASLLFGECCSACAMRPRVVVEAVEQSLSKRKVTATFSFQQTLERKSVLWAGRFYFPGRWFVLSEQRLSVIQTGVSGFPS